MIIGCLLANKDEGVRLIKVVTRSAKYRAISF